MQNTIPIVLLTDSKRLADKYIKDYVKNNQMSTAAMFVYEPDGTVITIDQVREITSLFGRFDPIRKLIVIHDFDSAKEPTQNALLKTLEEKSVAAQFILVSKNELSILPTIVSRCSIVKIKPSEKKEIVLNFDKDIATLLDEFSYIEKNSEKAITLCDAMLQHFHKYILDPDVKKKSEVFQIPSIVKEIMRVRYMIKRNNLGSQIAIDHLCIFIKKHLPS